MLSSLFADIKWDLPSLWIAIASITFNPLFWNIVARREYKTHFLTKLMGNNYTACYFLAILIFSLGIVRDVLYTSAIQEQPKTLPEQWSSVGGIGMIIGNLLVLSSMWQLGVTGTYLGDYFGIYMKKKVTSFPFNISNDPMYQGSTMNFIGYALWNRSKVGLLISLYVWLTYRIAILFEGPFTNEIYAKLEASRKKGEKKN